MKLFENMTLGFCHWDLLILIFLIAITAWYFIDRHRLNKQIKELKKR